MGCPLLALKQGEYLFQSTLWNSGESQPGRLYSRTGRVQLTLTYGNPILWTENLGPLPLKATPVSLWTADGSSLKPCSGCNPAELRVNKPPCNSGVMGMMVEGMTWASGPLPQLVPAGESRTR